MKIPNIRLERIAMVAISSCSLNRTILKITRTVTCFMANENAKATYARGTQGKIVGKIHAHYYTYCIGSKVLLNSIQLINSMGPGQSGATTSLKVSQHTICTTVSFFCRWLSAKERKAYVGTKKKSSLFIFLLFFSFKK